MSAEQFLEISIEAAGQHRAVVSMKIRPDMLNGHDVCHGGLIYTLAHAAWRHARGPGADGSKPESCSIEYLTPGRRGDRLTASAKLKAAENHEGVYDVAVMNQNGELVALFRGVGR